MPAGRRQSSNERSQVRWGQMGMGQAPVTGFKTAIAVIVFHFICQILVQFADILLPFIMSLILVSVLEPIKQVALSVLETTFLLLFRKLTCCRCCLRIPRKESSTRRDASELGELVKRLCLLVAIFFTLLLAGRLFWIIGRIIWLSGEAVTLDFDYYRMGVQKRQKQVQQVLKKLGLEKKVQLDMPHIANYALIGLKYAAEFFTQHVFYTMSQVCLTTIFALFLLYSPVQKDFSPVMRGVFNSMETYLKLKTYISVLMGITNGTALAIIGLELPAAWGLMTFCANFIPNIGGPLMSILPCVIALLDVRKTLYQVGAAFTAQFILHFTIANFVEPVVFGTTEMIHSVVVLLGLSFFGYIWGFTGMFLSVPLLFAMHAWLDTVARTKKYPIEAREDARFIMGMLEGQWLADSLENADDQAEMHVGQVESTETDNVNMDSGFERQLSSRSNEAHSQDSEKWVLTEELQAMCAFESEEGEVRPGGLLLRWLVLIGAYVLLFVGLSEDGLDLAVLIHPSGGWQDDPSFNSVFNDTNASTEVSEATTTLALSMHGVSTASEAFAASTTTLGPFADFGNDSDVDMNNESRGHLVDEQAASRSHRRHKGKSDGWHTTASGAEVSVASDRTRERPTARTPAPTPPPEEAREHARSSSDSGSHGKHHEAREKHNTHEKRHSPHSSRSKASRDEERYGESEDRHGESEERHGESDETHLRGTRGDRHEDEPGDSEDAIEEIHLGRRRGDRQVDEPGDSEEAVEEIHFGSKRGERHVDEPGDSEEAVEEIHLRRRRDDRHDDKPSDSEDVMELEAASRANRHVGKVQRKRRHSRDDHEQEEDEDEDDT